MINEAVITSGSLAVGTTVVIAAPALLMSLTLNPGSAASSLTVYDNASAGSGTILASLVGSASGSSIPFALNYPLFVKNGITVVVAGLAATAVLSYSKS